ncbi:MAG: 2Fe-2S iron-sulfur cluster binding domain-containing protein [Kordiimonadaceae bacterium]|nr:2Fe-2S iron-sulfur cluster binding domain-containing protein [Kordiimonadaceae bacterium]
MTKDNSAQDREQGHVTVHYEGSPVKCDPSKSLLDNLLEQELPIEHCCKKGSCLTCVLKTEDEVESKSRDPLKSTLVEQGYFLSCQQKPNDGMVIQSAAANDIFEEALVTEMIQKSGHVSQIFIKPYGDFLYKPGQFLNIRGPEGAVRSYSIASLPSDNILELHVKEHQFGIVSRWLCSSELLGKEVEISGPGGDCFYLPGKEDQSMLMIGTGTGLAPMMGILRDAKNNNHKGNIELYFGAVNEEGLYMRSELLALEKECDNLTVHFGTLEDGPINEMALKNHPDLSGWRVFLCGDPDMVKKTKTKAYLADAALTDIYSDPFDVRDVTL